MPEHIRTQSRDGIFTVTIDRPASKNAVNGPCAHELYQAFKYFSEEKTLKVAVLTGANQTFCSGADLKGVAKGADSNPLVAESDIGPMGPTRLDTGKPVIAAVEGFAVAGGLELALWCDLRVVAEDATLGVYCRRFGVPLIDGGTVRLPRLIGQSRAMDLILTGRPVKADEAMAIGLANRLAPSGQALAYAETLAEELMKAPQQCMRNDRQSVLEQWSLSTEEALMNEFRHGLNTMNSGEALAGAQAFNRGTGRHGQR